MPHLTVPALTPSLLILALTLVATTLMAQASTFPIKLQRRQSFFRCNGWGAGCSNYDYAFKAPSYSSRSEPRSTVTRTAPQPKPKPRQEPVHSGWSSHNYGLHFLFTSGSWSPNGKRQAPTSQANVLTSSTLRNILKGIQV